MATNWFSYYQVGSGRSDWKVMVDSQKLDVTGLVKPLYVTVLEVDIDINDETPPDMVMKAKYRGDSYFDWDCKNADEMGFCINDVNDFLDDLKKKGVKLECLRIYATGGRGFHVEIPWGIYSSERADRGEQYLPHIYREMARQMVGRYLDLSIYSAKRGRMWRQPNVQRENGNYKVPLTLDEMRRMTPEMYEEFCKAPRPEPERAEPVLCAEMLAMFSNARARVISSKTSKKKDKDKGKDLKKLVDYGGVPPTIQKLFDGENINPDTGLNTFAMQMGIAAHSLGITDPTEYLERIEGFIKERAKAPGDKNQTEGQIRQEMLRIFRYLLDNDSYEYSVQAVRGLLKDASQKLTLDLDGVKPAVLNEDGTEVEDPDQETDFHLRGGMVPCGSVIARTTQEGVVPAMNVTFDDDTTAVLYDPSHPDMPTNFIVSKCRVAGKLQKLMIIDKDIFSSPAKLQAFCNGYDGVATGISNASHTQGVYALVVDQVRRTTGKRKKYRIETEGMQLIKSPEDPNRVDMFWMSTSGPYMLPADAPDYVYMGFTGREGITRSNVAEAPDLELMGTGKDVIEALLNFNNSDATVSKLIGWMSALFIRPILVSVEKQFPLLSLVGEAGSGKTTGALVLLQLFSYDRKPELATLQGSTPYAHDQFLYGSKTVPLALDEAKEDSSKGDTMKWLSRILHEAYTPGQRVARGGGNAHNKSVMGISTQEVNAPVLYISEVMNGVPAIQERCLVAQFAKPGLVGREQFYATLNDNPGTVAALGKALITFACSQDINEVVDVYKECKETCRSKLFNQKNNRVVTNIAMAYTGLFFLRAFVRSVYGEQFDTRFDALMDSLLDPMSHPNLSVQSEASKTMSRLATLSQQTGDKDYALKSGVDYEVLPDGFVDLKIEAVYYKLALFSRMHGDVMSYRTPEAFAHGMKQYAACVDVKPTSTLSTSKGTKVYRFSIEKMAEEDIEMFKE